MRTHGHVLARIVTASVVALTGMVTGTTAVRGSTVVAVSRTAKEITSPHALAVDEGTGRVFAVNSGFTSTVSVLDATSGRLLRTVPVGTHPTAVAVDARTDRAFVLAGSPDFGAPGDVGNALGHVSVLDAATGRLLRTVAVGQRPLALVVDTATDRVFVVVNGAVGNGYAATVRVLNATTGDVLRTVQVGNNPEAVGVDEQTGHVFVAGDYRTCMLDARRGTLLRCAVAGNHPRAVLVNERANRVFIVSPDGTMDVLDGRTGAYLHTVMVGGSLQAAALDERAGYLFVAGIADSSQNDTASDGHLHVLDGASGKELRTVAVGQFPLAVAVAQRAGRVVVLTGGDGRSTGRVCMFDAAGGHLLRTTPMGTYPAAVAVDERIGHVFVLGGGSVSMLDARDGMILYSATLL